VTDCIRLAHGSGGRLTHRLIRDIFRRHFGDDVPLDDSFIARSPGERIAVTTDAYVVDPIFFPGGDIGRLAVSGTVNDLAVQGAMPVYIAVAFVLEEGLPLNELEQVVQSMAATCAGVGARIVAGDTKVVPRGKGDRLFVATSGLGVVLSPWPLSGANARAGDVVLVSGPVGEHEMAILVSRSGIELGGEFRSDVAPVLDLARALWESCEVHAMRDPTRGGLATALNEIARQSQVAIEVDEGQVPVRSEILGACELLGFDPLYLACEGRLIAVVPEAEAERALSVMRSQPLGRDAAVIGRVLPEPKGRVYLRTSVGGRRILDLLSGEQLPRIC